MSQIKKKGLHCVAFLSKLICENNGDNCDLCGEAKAESDSGLDMTAIIAIAVGVIAVIAAFATVIVVKKKKS